MHFKQHENKKDLLSLFFAKFIPDLVCLSAQMDLAGIMAGEQSGMEVTSILLA